MPVEDIQKVELGRLKETPYGARKTAELNVQYGIDPSYGLTKNRHLWYSNGVRHDSTQFTELDGAIELSTTTTSTDSARIRPAFPTNYQGQSLAEPGQYLLVDSGNVTQDANNLSSLTNGRMRAGAYIWDELNSVVRTGFFLDADTNGFDARLTRGGLDIDGSPVPQSEWNIDSLDGEGPSGEVFKPQDGYVYNWYYTWYGDGALIMCIKDTDIGQIVPFHAFDVDGQVALDTPDISPHTRISNNGDTESLTVISGEMQYTLYGSINETVRTRLTTENVFQGNNAIDVDAQTTAGAIDPTLEPGVPILSVKRDPNEENPETLSVRLSSFIGKADAPTIIFVWNEWDELNALTNENFTSPESKFDDAESHLLTDTSATDYTPSNAILRGSAPIESGKNQSVSRTEVPANNRLPIESTLIFTAASVPGGSDTQYQPFNAVVTEGF